MNSIKLPVAAITLMTFYFCGGCCNVQPEFVPVREAIYRTELSTTNRLALPLNEPTREFLLSFLKSGRNPAMDNDGTIADAEAPERFSDLLELLSRQENLSVTNLIADEKFRATTLFKPWFRERAVRQIVDAHEDWPHVRQPYAFLDAWNRHWWVFYHERRELTHVMVTRALEPKKPR